MSLSDTRPFRASRYTTGAIVLHWTIAALVLAQVAGGWAMEDLLAKGSGERYVLSQLHKSVGITILVLTVARVCWRLFNPPPPEPASVARWETVLASAVHKLFYALLVLVPLAGWLLVSVSSLGVPTVLFFADVLPWPHLPGFAGLAPDDRHAWEAAAATAHGWLAWTMAALVALHVVGALKHHLADGAFLRRMWVRAPGDGPRRAFGRAATVVVTVAFAGTMIACAAVARRAGDEAAPAPVTVVAADPAQSGWVVVPAESRLGFTVRYGNAPLAGGFGAFAADILFDPADLPAARIAVTVDLATARLDGTDISAAQLKGPDGLAAAPGAVARFESTAVRAAGDAYVADGTLTLRGTTVPVALAFDVDIAGDRATATGTATLDRLQFGVGKDSDPAGLTLAPAVAVDFTVVATRR